MNTPRTKPKGKPVLTDVERQMRFKAMAAEVEADENVEAFDRAFEQIVNAPIPKP